MILMDDCRLSKLIKEKCEGLDFNDKVYIDDYIEEGYNEPQTRMVNFDYLLKIALDEAREDLKDMLRLHKSRASNGIRPGTMLNMTSIEASVYAMWIEKWFDKP